MPSVDFYFDYASPWSYLASEILSRSLPGAAIVYRPIYLRGLESFQEGIPYKSAKLAYMAKDLARCAAREGVTLNGPHTFPLNGLYALRGALVAQREGVFDAYHAAMFRAAWRDSREISSKDGVATIARELGLAAVADGLDGPDVKAKLREETDGAIARGVFGVPAFFVGDEMFWGHDRLPYVRTALGSASG